MADFKIRQGFHKLLLLGCLAATAHGATDSLPLEWSPGEFFFRVNGRPSFVLGRNPTGTTCEMFNAPFAQAAASGEMLARIHLTVGPPQKSRPGELDEAWCAHWEKIFDAAAENGICIVPVLAVWADWNDGSRGENWHKWNKNPYNIALNGCAREPGSLLVDGQCRRLWLNWLGQLVRRWQTRPNIAAWEIFSEVDLVSGATPEKAESFVRAASAIVRQADPHCRPVTVSLSGLGDWARIFEGGAIDIVQIHPYGKNLDELILKTVPQRLVRYRKPVLIGESGLDAAGPNELCSSPRACVGMRHAIWAEMVSGAMTGRMFWWEDGYDFYSGVNLRDRYKSIGSPAVGFANRLNFERFRPVEVVAAEGLKGAAIGNEKVVVGWFRDEACEPPNWPVRRLENKTVRLKLPASLAQVEVEFFDPASGSRVPGPAIHAGRQEIKLPAFEDAIAFVLRNREAR